MQAKAVFLGKSYPGNDGPTYKKSMNKPEAAGRMVQWAIELSQFDIEYLPKTAIKAQALVDFIAEFTFRDEDNLTNEAERWTI